MFQRRFLPLALFLLTFIFVMHATGQEPADEQRVVDRFWTLLEKSPRRGTAFDRVYTFYSDAGQLDRLESRCQNNIVQKQTAAAWTLLGLVQARRGQVQDAETSLTKAVELDATEFLAPFYLGEMLFQRGRLGESTVFLETALSRIQARLQTPNDTDRPASKDLLALLQTLGRVYERFADRDNADRIWSLLERYFVDDPEILLQIAETLEAENKLEDALQRYRRAEKLIRNDNDARYRARFAAADLDDRLGRTDVALADLETLLDDLSPKSWQAGAVRNRIETVLLRRGGDAELARYYGELLERRPGDEETVRRLAAALRRLHRNDEARGLLQGAVDRNPSSILLRSELAELLLAGKNDREARRQFEAIDELAPNDPDYLVRWARAALENSDENLEARKSKAAAILRRFADRDPNDAVKAVTTAEMMSDADLPEAAEKMYRNALRLRPGDPGILEAQGRFYHRYRQPEKAVTTFLETVQGDRRSAANLVPLAGVLRSLGYRKEAAELLREAVAEQPENVDYRLRYADSLLETDGAPWAAMEILAAESLVEPLSESHRRVLTALISCYQRTGTLDDAVAALRNKISGQKTVSAAEYWKLSLLLAAVGEQDMAIPAVEQALAGTDNSVVLLETAADLYEKNRRPDRAAEIFETLSGLDSRRRLDHLKRLAELNKQLGRIDRAVDTARLVMAIGAGNPANVRYYAEMLIADGRIEDGIAVLRRAVQLDGGDKTSLSVLANLLFETGQTESAFEILWRIFEKSENSSEKLAVVSQLTACYRQAGRFDELLDRLRHLPPGTDRFNVGLCLSQAYQTVSNFDESRRILETLLASPDANRRDEVPMILSRLSALAEQQDDLSSAIRYQEMLCDKPDADVNVIGENERLLMLYRKSGNENAATEILLHRIVRLGDLRARLAAVDDLLAHADYHTSRDVLDRLDRENPDHWEIVYRRGAAEFWLGDIGAAEKSLQKLLALEVPVDETSVLVAGKKETEAGEFTRSSVTPWSFERQADVYSPENSPLNRLQWHWTRSNIDLFETIFRDRLRLHGGGSFGTTQTNSPRPLFVPETVADARFAAVVWQLRLALQKDFEPLETKSPAEAKRLGFLASDAPAFPFIHYRDELKRFRANHPPDGDRQRVEQRLRLEFFLEQARIITESNPDRFGDVDFSQLFLDGLGTAAGDRRERLRALETVAAELRCRLERELAFHGDRNWYDNVYYHVVDEMNLDFAVKLFEKVDILKRFHEATHAEEVRDRFTKEEIDNANRTAVVRFRAFQDQNRKNREKEKWTSLERIEFMFRFWEDTAEIVAEGKLAEYPKRREALSVFSAFLVLLREQGFSEQIPRAEAIRQRILGSMTPLEAAVLEAESGNAAEPLTDHLGGDRLPIARFLSAYNYGKSLTIALRPQKNAARNETVRDGFRDVAVVVRWLENKPDPAMSDRRFNEAVNRFDAVGDAVLRQRQREGDFLCTDTSSAAADIEPLLDRMIVQFASFQMSNLLTVIMPAPADSHSNRGSAQRKVFTITPEYLDRIDMMEKDIDRIQDFYFRLMNRIESAEKRFEAPPLQKIPSLQEFLPFFERWQGNRQPPSASSSAESPPMVFLAFYSTLETVDHFLRTNRLQSGIDPTRRRTDRLDRYRKYLEEKRASGTPIERRLSGRFLRWREDMVRIATPTPKSAREYRLELEADEKEAADRGEALPAERKLMLAVYNRWDGNPAKAVEYLDAVPFAVVDDLRFREQLVLRLYKEQPENASLKNRAETAVDRLLGYQLKEAELVTLYETLSLLGETEKADRVRDRLLFTAVNVNTQYKLLDSLNKNPGVGGDSKAVRFAFRVLQSPAIASALVGRRTFAPETRNLAVEILEKAGKLHEFVEQTERQIAVTPCSPELTLSLVDLYFRTDRQDEAMALVGDIERMVATRKITSQDYENLLRQRGLRRRIADLKQRTETEEAAFRLQSLQGTPEKLLEKLPVEVLVYERSHLIPDFIETLKRNPPETLAAALVDIMPHVENWLDNFYWKESAAGLLEYVWRMDGVGEKSKRSLRFMLLESFSYKTSREECYPMFHEAAMDLVHSDDADPGELFRPTHVEGDRIHCTATTLLDLAEKLGKLYELDRRFLDSLGSTDDPSVLATILASAAEVRRQNDGHAFELIQPLLKRAEAEERARNILSSARLFLAQELSRSVHPAVVKIAAELYREGLRDKPKNHQIETIIRNSMKQIEGSPESPTK